MTPRPVAFRILDIDRYDYTDDEAQAQLWAERRGVDYEGLYLVADRSAPTIAVTADVGGAGGAVARAL